MANSQAASKSRSGRGSRAGGGSVKLDGSALIASIFKSLLSGATYGRIALALFVTAGMVGGLCMLPLEKVRGNTGV